MPQLNSIIMRFSQHAPERGLGMSTLTPPPPHPHPAPPLPTPTPPTHTPPSLEFQGLFFRLVLFCSFCHVIFLLMVRSSDFYFTENSEIFWVESQAFCMALIQQLWDDGGWYVQFAAIWHWYLPLCIYMTFVYFLLFLSILFYSFLLV